MTQKDVELILLRQWASHLAMPVWIAGTEGELIFYNEPAESLLQRRFDEAGEMPLDQLSTLFKTAAEDGTPVSPAELPLGLALREGRPAHGRLRIETSDGVVRTIEITAIPLVVQGGRNLGAVVFFWEYHA